MAPRRLSRRAVLRTGAVAATAAVAGCLGGGGDGDGTDPDAPTVENEPDYGDWFDGVDNYEATRDFTDREEVSVAVGAPGNGGNYAFSPPAIAVSPGTTVVWEWTGKSGPHNVVEQDGGFASERKSGDDASFTHEFSMSGVHRYFCQPHISFGMKGAVEVR